MAIYEAFPGGVPSESFPPDVCLGCGLPVDDFVMYMDSDRVVSFCPQCKPFTGGSGFMRCSSSGGEFSW